MGWREVLNDVANDAPVWPEDLGEACASALLSMPAPDRIAMARELLAGTGFFVAREYPPAVSMADDMGETSDWGRGFEDGFNALRELIAQENE